MTEPIGQGTGTGPSLPIWREGMTELGTFVPGYPLADIPALSPWDTIFQQYANSPAITTLIKAWFAAIDRTTPMVNFFDNVWNPDTANGYGLDIWGRIVGIDRVLTLSESAYLAFEQSGPPGVGWSQGPFYSGQPITLNFTLGDQTYRNLIFAKALANVSSGFTWQLNQILLTMFKGRGKCWVSEGLGRVPFFGFAESGTAFGFHQAPFWAGERQVLNRGLAYNFEFPLSTVDVGLIATGVIPRPLGVPAAIQYVY